MNYQEHMIEASRKAAEEFFKYAKSVPADKLEWAPMDAGRSVISLCQEIAMTPTWGHDVIAGDPSKWTEGDREEQGKMMKGWTTVADCEREFNARFEKLAALYRSLPDAELEKTKWLPYDGGRDFTIREMLDYPRWNANYHVGQIGYIQTLYGDKDMH